MATYPKLVETVEINQVEDGYAIYQAVGDRVHFLNHTAVLVLESCTGENSPDEIVRIVQDAFGLAAAPEQDVKDCLATMIKEGLVA